jgi:hypothetical protein
MMPVETNLQKSPKNGLVLRRNFHGGPWKFLSQVPNVYLNLENITGTPIDDAKKSRTLFIAVQEKLFDGVITTI